MERNMSTSTGDQRALYFAYGTLLDINHMHQSCPSAEPLGTMRLKGYRLGFGTCAADPKIGGCTLKREHGHTLYGILYELPANEMADLDQAAGIDRGLWVKINVTLKDAQGNRANADTYTIGDDCGDYRPPETYLQLILDGAAMWDIPTSYLTELQETIAELK